MMGNVKSPLPTSPFSSLLAWNLGAFLLAAIDLAEGQTVSWPEIEKVQSLISST